MPNIFQDDLNQDISQGKKTRKDLTSIRTNENNELLDDSLDMDISLNHICNDFLAKIIGSVY